LGKESQKESSQNCHVKSGDGNNVSRAGILIGLFGCRRQIIIISQQIPGRQSGFELWEDGKNILKGFLLQPGEYCRKTAGLPESNAFDGSG
jgi:hypothetical protein